MVKKDKKDKKSKIKSILKKSKTTLKIPERKVESVWNDLGRFFKQEMEEATDSLFFL
jgi:hypothetical protein